jgi:hypothetical protein
MKYPNLRYGNPAEFVHYTRGIPDEYLAKDYRRSIATIKAWKTGKEPVPFWVPELARLRDMELRHRARQMGYSKLPARLGVVTGAQIVAFDRLGKINTTQGEEIEIQIVTCGGPAVYPDSMHPDGNAIAAG